MTAPQLFREHGEVTDRESIKALLTSVSADLGDDGLTLLINNAGCLKRLGLGRVSQEDIVDSFRVNAVAPLLISQAFIPLLKKSAVQSSGDSVNSHRAAIVSISTLTASIRDNFTGGNYDSRTSKVALTLSVDLKDDGIVACVLDPGWVKTDLGGTGGKLEVSDSVSRMIKVINRLSMENTGGFLNYTGKTVP